MLSTQSLAAMWSQLLLFILIPLSDVLALITNSSDRKRHLFAELYLKCGHLSNNESIAHCFTREMQVLELKYAIESAFKEDENLTQNSAVIGEFKAAKVSFSCLGESCEEKNADFASNTVTISSTNPPPELAINNNRYWFNLARFFHSTVEQAEVLFHLNKFRRNYANQTYIISLSKFGPANTITEHFSKVYRFDNSPLPEEDEDYAEDDIRQDDWLNIEMTSYFKEWQRNPLTNHGLQVHVTVQDDQGNINVIENLKLSNKDIYMEILNPQRAHRKRRSTRSIQAERTKETNCTNGTDRCCLYSFEINSRDLEFTFLEPQTFKLNYCLGYCLSSNDGCCASENSAPIEIWYRTQHDGSSKSKNISNALIQKCNCL